MFKTLLKNQLATTLIVAGVVAGLAFFAGIKYHQARQPVSGQPFRQMGQPGGRQGSGEGRMLQGSGTPNRQAFLPVAGEILSADATSITVKLADGGSKIVLVNPKTEIAKADQATLSDLKVGQTVVVFGQTNSDGSVSAQTIQLKALTEQKSAN